MPKPTYEELEATIETLANFLNRLKPDYAWMLTAIKRGSDETSGGNYSDELKQAIETGKILAEV